jgi:hypothetical protein
MKLITVTNNYKQLQTLILDDGTSFDMEIRYVPRQQGWFITEISYLSFRLTGARIVVSPNLLFQLKNQIPFGIACYSQGSREPMLVEDFNSGAAQLYLLNAAEVQETVRLVLG